MGYKSQENAVFIAIHPTTYRGGGISYSRRVKDNSDNTQFEVNRKSLYKNVSMELL